MKIIEGATAHDVRRALAAHLKAEGQADGDMLWAPGPVVLSCARPQEIWDAEPHSPMSLLIRWLGYAAQCEQQITSIASGVRDKQRVAVCMDLKGGEAGSTGHDVLSYLVGPTDIQILWTRSQCDLTQSLASTGLHLALLAAACEKRPVGVRCLVGFARGTQEAVDALLGRPAAPTVPCPPLISTPLRSWLSDLDTFTRVGSKAIGYKDRFFRATAVPLHRAMCLLDQGAAQEAQVMASTILHDNWRYLAQQWIFRGQRPAGAAS